MSSLRKGAPPPRMKKKNSDTAVISNGNGSTSLYYANDPPDDENMNEIADENVELTVLLPEGNVRDTSVNSNIPMMDLLVNLAATNKLSPAGYTIVVLNEETRKPVDYKPNQTIGSLCPKNVNGTPRHLTLQLAPKKGDSEKQRNVKNAQPFEMTKRFTVNLPQNQKKVLRISPNTQLEVIRQQICSEKHLDPFRYTFQLPSDPYNNLDMQLTVGDLKSQEINMTGAGTVNSAMSMPNLSGNQRTEQNLSYMPSAGETKKKKGFFSFLKKDNSKKFSVQSVQRDAYVEQPPPSRERPIRSTSQDTPSEQSNRNPGARPKTMYAVSTSNLDKISDAKMTVPPLDLSGLNNSQNASSKSKSMSALKAESDKIVAPPRKKRRAPPPPQAQCVQNTVQVEVSVEKQKMEKQVKSKQEISEIRQRTENISNKYHSRNSSDSSGYHELTLSGAESPDGPRIDEHLEGEINVETASLDSGGLLNGDSGIRDISPSSRRKDIDGEIGSSQTLPLERTKKKAVSSSTPRSSSLDRTGKKKKAPPPPPGPPPQPPVKTSISSTAPAPKTKKKDDDVAINAVLDSLDQNLDDQDTSGEGMMMVENSSIHSEDIDVDLTLSHQPRPCAFIAPPPPLEPPPDDSEPVDYNMIINGRVDTVDVGVETSDDSNSYGPVSTRSSTDSPVSRLDSLIYWEDNVHSRAESHTSISSVNTVDDVSMDFERTIAVCQEEVMRAEQETPEYKTEMAQFVEKMKEMTVDGSKKVTDDFDEDVTSNEAVADDAVYIFSKDNGEDSDEMESIPQSESKQSEKDQIQNMRNSDREVSEITYDFKINTVPPEFQSGMEAPDEVEYKEENKEVQHEKEEEEEEEIVITETFEIIYPFSEPEKVEAEVETERTEVSYVTEKKPEVKMEELQTKQDKIPEVAKVPQIIQEEKVIPKEPEKPKPKEEFVLTFDDLSKVDFSLMRKKKKIQPKPKPTYQSTPEKRHTVATLDEIKSNFAINNDNVFITPTKGHNIEMDDGFIITEAGSVRGHKGEVKTKCSELSFSPNSEGEMEHVLEEKSISMINLPAVRASLDSSLEENKSEDNVKDDIVVSRTEIVFSVNSNSTKQEDDSSGRKTSVSSNLEKSVNDSGVEAESDSNIDHQEVLTAQYKQLQQQFSMWKIQLEENKRLLSSSQAIPSDETTKQFQQQLQSQIQLQQQMIQQMQQSMEALSSQQQQGSLVDQSSQNNLPSSLDKSSQKQISVDIGNHVDQTIESTSVRQTFVPPPPVAPALPNGKANVEVTSSNEQTKPKSKSKPRKYIEPKLDPREELMIAIKNFGGRSAMKKVPVNKTHWHSGIP
ncbi:ankycorbin-like isoform X3 [Mytilus californianus]|nr:ankycorbin-like isoform X3 [Mytilus californianus]XP_052094760.1 ankycorbin-like isoform X3 [Mytilus californianus]XP_052094761.1 ankycorbin-like isoform X3 [Mytilus californianus]XP_052094762.1 ankycorbin-like isoform X3 [Mytilus californianus]XP_052094763.1 ankycorbin-like isoform X3 [Mytilus californianus]